MTTISVHHVVKWKRKEKQHVADEWVDNILLARKSDNEEF